MRQPILFSKQKIEKGLGLDLRSHIVADQYRLSSIDDADKHCITFCSLAHKQKLAHVESSIVLLPEALSKNLHPSNIPVCVSNPAWAMNHLVLYLTQQAEKPCQTIHHSVMSETDLSSIQNLSAGPLVTIGSHVKLGKNVVIKAGAVINDHVSIGDGSVIEENSVIKDNVWIGEHCVIGAHCVIGDQGFGYVHDQERNMTRVKHVGGVIIGDYVEVGSHSSINKGTYSDTRIGEHTKLDCHTHIAHNVNVGRHGIMAAMCGIAGSTKIGDYFTMGGQSGVVGQITITDHVTVASRTGIIKDITKPAKFIGLMAGTTARAWGKMMRKLKQERSHET